MIKKIGYIITIVSFAAILSPFIYMPSNIFLFLTIQSYGPIILFALGIAFIFGDSPLKNNVLPITSLSLLFSVFSDLLALYLQPQINSLAQHSSTQNLSVSVSRPTLYGIIIMIVTDFIVTSAVTFLFVYVANKFRSSDNKILKRG